MKAFLAAVFLIVQSHGLHMSTRGPSPPRQYAGSGRGRGRGGGRGRGRGGGRGGFLRRPPPLPTKGLLERPDPWWKTPSTIGDLATADDVSLRNELQRRGLSFDGDNDALVARIIETDKLHSLADSATSFRAAVITTSDEPPPQCYPETYEDSLQA
jgi:hypothetical protein